MATDRSTTSPGRIPDDGRLPVANVRDVEAHHRVAAPAQFLLHLPIQPNRLLLRQKVQAKRKKNRFSKRPVKFMGR